MGSPINICLTAKGSIIMKAYFEKYSTEKTPEATDEAKIYLVTAIEDGVKLYNSLISSDEAKAEDTVKVFKAIKSFEDKYNSLSKDEYMRDKKVAPEGAMMAAIKDPTYAAVRVRNAKDDDGNPKLANDTVNKTINLIALHKFCGGIGVDTGWVNSAKKLWMLLIARGVFEKLPDDASEETIKNALTSFVDCDFMKTTAKMKALGKSLTSNTKILEKLAELINRMIGEDFKPLTNDVRFILQTYCQKDRRNEATVKYCTEKGFADILLDVCRRMVCGIQYKDSFKLKSK